MTSTPYHRMKRSFKEFQGKAGSLFTLEEENGLFSLYFKERRVISPCPCEDMHRKLMIRINILDQGEL